MPNHFDMNSDSFDSLLTDDNNSVNDQTSTVETLDTNDLLVNSDDNTVTNTEDDINSQKEDTSDNKDFITSFLNEYGIKDRKITYENDDGTTNEVDFNDLDSNEKFNILKELATPNLSKDEINVINYLRANNATIQDVINYYANKAVEDYISQNGPAQKHYEINDFSDDELYVADLRSQYDNMTDDEIKADLEAAKENEELFKKKVETIRKRYIEEEEASNKARIQEQENQFNNFKQALESQLDNFNEISMDYKDHQADSLQIEDSEKDNIYNYILNLDENGTSQFFKDLNNPRKLIELAWFSLYGKEAISDISNYWKNQLKNSRRSEPKSQTTIIKQDGVKQRDNFMQHRNIVETNYGENLL